MHPKTASSSTDINKDKVNDMTGPAGNNNNNIYMYIHKYIVSVEAISEMPAHCNFGDVTIHVIKDYFFGVTVYCILEDLKHQFNMPN